jgi:hypothetical protein
MVYSFVYAVTDLDTVGKVVGGLVLESNGLQKMIDRAYKDPIAGILLKNSNITVTQYETLIIDYLTTNASDIEITFENKALYRSKKVSRGSFSRTLSQARGNIISSIYTLLLLAYLGIFDTVPFDDYRNLAEKLIEYRQLIDLSGEPQNVQFLRRIERELLKGIKMLAEPRSLSTL